jgi:hypothetical protein
VLKSRQTTNGETYTFATAMGGDGYEYKPASLAAITYPSKRRVAFTLDEAGRIAAVTGTANNTTVAYAGSVIYAPHGGMSSGNLGARAPDPVV